MSRHLILLLLGLLAAQHAHAQMTVMSCNYDSGMVVISKTRWDETGSDFIIRKTASPLPRCVFTQQPGDIRIPESEKIGNDWYYIGFQQGKLLLDAGTANTGRELIVIDAATGKTLRNIPSLESPTVEGNFAIITDETEIPASKKQCPEVAAKYLPNTIIAIEKKVDLTTFKITPTQKRRCVYME
ncbi:MAG: hypothetical protein LBV44_02285 [Methylobacillus sp.]|jgi:hypothetical protein|nr:hypothetical protein [Methylobacillus sp.]